MIEVHNNPETALCDAAQALTPAEYLKTVRELRGVHGLLASGASE
jgi:3-deoxy-D-arabino-heptulosonate 7-phosphate (DAHP) synthase